MVSQSSIARQLNLSQRTVSLVLAGSNRVAEHTRQRVVKAAQELGYRPNRSALSMRSGRFNAVAVLQSNRPGFSYLSGTLLDGLQQSVDARGMHLVLAKVPDQKLTDESYLPSVLREWSVDGFLVNYNAKLDSRLVDVIDGNRLPSIWLNTKRPYDCVFPDELAAGKMLTEHLLALGHRRIAFFSNRHFEKHFSVADRHDGYAAAMTHAGLTPQSLLFADEEFKDADGGFEFVRSFLRSPARPTAIVAYEAFEAARVLYAALQMGLSVPRDLSLATFHDTDMRHTGFPITVAEIPESEMGQRSLDSLLRRIDGPDERTLPSQFRTPEFPELQRQCRVVSNCQ